MVTLIPWRDGDELREQSWDAVRPHLEALGWPIYLGDRPGPWSRGAAINAAARDAGNWDAALIADADTVPEHKTIHTALGVARRTGGGVRPHDKLWRLTASGSIALVRKGTAALEERHFEAPPFGPTYLGGGLLVVTRDGWDRVGGFDETFVGWGHEDSVLNISLLVKADWDRIPGNAWHLWHPEARRNTPDVRRNRLRLERFRREHLTGIREASERKGYAVGRVL